MHTYLSNSGADHFNDVERYKRNARCLLTCQGAAFPTMLKEKNKIYRFPNRFPSQPNPFTFKYHNRISTSTSSFGLVIGPQDLHAEPSHK